VPTSVNNNLNQTESKIQKWIRLGGETRELQFPVDKSIMDWAHHQPELRFDIRAERAEYERLFTHAARVLQDQLVRLGGGDRTKEIPVAEWKRVIKT
jgi:hypothetical protein